MAENNFVTIKMKERETFESVLASLEQPAKLFFPNHLDQGDPLARMTPPGKVLLSELGLRSLMRLDGQAVYMEHWDGESDPVKVEDIVNMKPEAVGANKGRIRFMLTSEVQASLEYGQLKRLIDTGLFENEGFESY